MTFSRRVHGFLTEFSQMTGMMTIKVGLFVTSKTLSDVLLIMIGLNSEISELLFKNHEMRDL